MEASEADEHNQCVLKNLVPFVGIELTTYRLQGDCSTTELKRHTLILLDDLEMTHFAFAYGRSRGLFCNEFQWFISGAGNL